MNIVRKVHIYLGLLSFTHFMVYGVAGLSATLQTTFERPKPIQSTRYVAYSAGAGRSDKQVADEVFQRLNLPFTRPMPDWFLQHSSDGHLLLDFYNINGIYRVTVLESENRLRIDEIRNGLWLFLEDIHASGPEDGEHFRLLRLWGFYNEFAMWTLLGMTLSGIYLWVAARKRPFRWIRNIHLWLGLGAAPFLLLYGVSAVQMLHNAWFKLKPVVSEMQLTLNPGLDDAHTVAKLLRDRGVIRGDLDPPSTTPTGLHLRVAWPAAAYEVDYDRASGSTRIKKSAHGFLGVLNRLHHSAGIWHEYWVLRIWTGFVALVSLALFALGGTGVYLWFERRRERLIGFVLLGFNLIAGLGLLGAIRSGPGGPLW